MVHEIETIEIPLRCRHGQLTLNIYPDSANAKMFVEEVPYPGEPRYHLQEGCRYQYELSPGYQFEESDIISHSKNRHHPNMGSIDTGIYVGLLTLPFYQLSDSGLDTEESLGKVLLEVRSVKTDYESDYRQMLDDIAGYYTDLVLLQGSPVTQHLEVDDNASSSSLYQKFSFVRSTVDSEAFGEAIHKIISNPVRKWTDTTVSKEIVGVRHLSRRNVRQISSSKDRILLPLSARNGKPESLTSVPRRLDVDYMKDTVDCQENQFVKFALRTFMIFCTDLIEKKNASDRLKVEASRTVDNIARFLETPLFRHISIPSRMNMNSPVLQRKEGYREVFQAWLMFDLAAKLNWDGGDNVYEAGKKNVATLYEYWLFFKLQELISQFFDLNEADKARLVKFDSDSINLNIVQGRTQVLRGVSRSLLRNLNVSFYYNRTFSKGNDDPIHKAGSWTMSMRPDYTLSLWPGEISEVEAEREELVVHIHFDAKYRLNKILLADDGGDLPQELSKEKDEQEIGIYKRADLLKMHAYKDAIRRTSGAYVLYPGTETSTVQGFHEIVPGLGAFSIRPGSWERDSVHLKKFLSEVKTHMLNRVSAREELSYYKYDIYKDASGMTLMDPLPEPVGENRDFRPKDISVLVGYYRSESHLKWILDNHLYNVRAGDDKGSVSLSPEMTNARYLLLHDSRMSEALIRIKAGGPKVYTRAQLIKMGYPPYVKNVTDSSGVTASVVDEERESREANRIYLVYQLFATNDAEKELRVYRWSAESLQLYGKRLSLPWTVRLSELMTKALPK